MLLLVKTLIVRWQLPVICCLLLFGTASAQTIGNWTLNNTLVGTGSALNTVSAISAGPGVTSTSFNGSTEWYGQNGFPAGGSPSAAAYLQFTITPNSGYEINIASVVLRIRRSNTGSPAGSGPTQWCLRSSLDGYGANISVGTMTHNYANYSVPLSGFNMLPGAVTFRLFGYGVTVSSGGNSRFVLDNISIVGSLFILPLQLLAPEASAEENGDIKIAWKADDITAGTKFSLQRSTDGSSFINLYTAIENNQVAQRYTFTDNTIPGSIQKIYYRVEAEEPNGTKQLSRVITVNRKISLRLNIEKIAVRGSLMQAIVQAPSRGNYTIAVYSSSGILLHRQQLLLDAGSQSVPVSLHKISKGMYVLSVSGNNGVVSRPFLFPVP